MSWRDDLKALKMADCNQWNVLQKRGETAQILLIAGDDQGAVRILSMMCKIEYDLRLDTSLTCSLARELGLLDALDEYEDFGKLPGLPWGDEK